MSNILLVFLAFSISHVISEDVTEQPQDTQEPKCLTDVYISNAANEVSTFSFYPKVKLPGISRLKIGNFAKY